MSYLGYVNTGTTSGSIFTNASSNDVLLYPATSNQKLAFGALSTGTANAAVAISYSNSANQIAVSGTAAFDSNVAVRGGIQISM